jgi:hypothetical protein
MDPNEFLAQVRATVARVLDRQDTGADHAETVLLLATLAGDVRDLDTWLSDGWPLPTAWERRR